MIEDIIRRERAIRRDCRRIVAIAHRESWLIGSPQTQRATVQCQRVFHTRSIARERADRAFNENPQYLEAMPMSHRFVKSTDGRITVFRHTSRSYAAARFTSELNGAGKVTLVGDLSFSATPGPGTHPVIEISKEEYHALTEAKLQRIRSAGRDPIHYRSPQDSWVRNADLEGK